MPQASIEYLLDFNSIFLWVKENGIFYGIWATGLFLSYPSRLHELFWDSRSSIFGRKAAAAGLLVQTWSLKRYFVPLRHCTDVYKCVQCTSVYWVLNAPCANAVAQHSAAVAARPYLSSKPRRRRSSPTAQHLQLLQPCLVGFFDRLVLQHSSFVMFNDWAIMLHGASPVQDGLAGHSWKSELVQVVQYVKCQQTIKSNLRRNVLQRYPQLKTTRRSRRKSLKAARACKGK